MDPLSLTALVHQKGNKAVEAVVGFIDRMDEAERELECKRRDGTAFTSALRTLHLKDDEQSVVRLSLWGDKAAVREPRREQLRVGDLLVVTNVQIDTFMGDKAFKASGFRPKLCVIRGLAGARQVLDRMGLGEPAPYLTRVEQLWWWKELEDLRGERMRRQAHQREAALLTAAAAAAAEASATTATATATASTNGFDALCLGQEDAHVCGTALPLTWVERVPKASSSSSAAASAPRVAPRFLRTKLTDGKGVSHILDLPQGTEGLLAFEYAARAAANPTIQPFPQPPQPRYHPLPVLLHALGARAVGGLLVPCPTPRTRVTLLPTTTMTTTINAGAGASAGAGAAETGAAPPRVLSVGAARALLVEREQQQQQQQRQRREGGMGMDAPPMPVVLHLRGRVVGVGVGADRATLFPSPPEEEDGVDVQEMVGRLVVPGGDGAGAEGWRYRDIYLRVLDAAAPPGSTAPARISEERQEEEEVDGLWVRVPDAVLRPLLAHIPAGRLVEEAEAMATAAAAAAEDEAAETRDDAEEEGEEEKEKTAGGAQESSGSDSAASWFYARWALRALRALASTRNPPFRLAVRVDAAATDAATAAAAPPPASVAAGGILASQLPYGGGGGGMLLQRQKPKFLELELELVRLAEAPVEAEGDAMEEGAGGGGGD